MQGREQEPEEAQCLIALLSLLSAVMPQLDHLGTCACCYASANGAAPAILAMTNMLQCVLQLGFWPCAKSASWAVTANDLSILCWRVVDLTRESGPGRKCSVC